MFVIITKAMKKELMMYDIHIPFKYHPHLILCDSDPHTLCGILKFPLINKPGAVGIKSAKGGLNPFLRYLKFSIITDI